MSFTSKFLPVAHHRYFSFFAEELHSVVAWGGTEPAFGTGLSGRTGLDIIYG